jgi:putative salt-induced outer membrane protein YdiY
MNRLALGSVSLLLVLALTNISHGQNLPPTMFATPKSFVELPKDAPPPPAPAPGDGPATFLPPIAVVNPWSGAMEFGINGANGNSDNFNLRYGLGVRRKTDDNIFNFDTVYNYASQDDVVTQNRLFSIGREEWYFRGTPWGIFVDGTFEYDEFRAFDFRIASHVGLTYKFIDNVQTMLKGRAGAGVSREFGGPNDDWIPELIFGLDFEHKFSDNTKVFTTADYIPNINNFSDFRLQLAAGFETMLSKEYNLALKLGAQNLYDSTPEGRKPNDVFYFVSLIWKF